MKKIKSISFLLIFTLITVCSKSQNTCCNIDGQVYYFAVLHIYMEDRLISDHISCTYFDTIAIVPSYVPGYDEGKLIDSGMPEDVYFELRDSLKILRGDTSIISQHIYKNIRTNPKTYCHEEDILKLRFSQAVYYEDKYAMLMIQSNAEPVNDDIELNSIDVYIFECIGDGVWEIIYEDR